MKLKQLTEWVELEGKTIKEVHNQLSIQAIVFTDDTFCILDSDYETSLVQLSSHATINNALSLGLITQAEANAFRAEEDAKWKKEKREERRQQYLLLKQEFENDQK